jgi:hypothetical protein
MKEIHMLKQFTLNLMALSLFTTSALAGGWIGGPGGSGGKGGSQEEEYTYYRIDCRYHGQDQDGDHDHDHGSDNKGGFDKNKLGEKGGGYGAPFCYGSAVYRIDDKEFKDVHLAIGCDNRTLFNEDARVHTEMTLDRFQPNRAATPAIEVFPHGQLTTEGTYTSVLDVAIGRIKGLCYVHRVKYDDMGRKY